MASKFFLLVAIVLSVYIVQSSAFPKDSTAFQSQHEKLPNGDSIVGQKTETATTIVAEPKIPGRITCLHEEATEDVVCQEHCLPKGYSYGLCISNTCSCI